jgi:hypothetical protein
MSTGELSYECEKSLQHVHSQVYGDEGLDDLNNINLDNSKSFLETTQKHFMNCGDEELNKDLICEEDLISPSADFQFETCRSPKIDITEGIKSRLSVRHDSYSENHSAEQTNSDSNQGMKFANCT